MAVVGMRPVLHSMLKQHTMRVLQRVQMGLMDCSVVLYYIHGMIQGSGSSPLNWDTCSNHMSRKLMAAVLAGVRSTAQAALQYQLQRLHTRNSGSRRRLVHSSKRLLDPGGLVRRV